MILVSPLVKSSSSSNLLALLATRALAAVEICPVSIARFRSVVARPKIKPRVAHFPDINPSRIKDIKPSIESVYAVFVLAQINDGFLQSPRPLLGVGMG
jgi:hypothetical protein